MGGIGVTSTVNGEQVRGEPVAVGQVQSVRSVVVDLWSTEENFLLAHAFLSILAAGQRELETSTDGLIAFTRNEIRHRYAVLIQPAHTIRHRLRWSTWRRRHQHRARTSHYQRRSDSHRDHGVRLEY
ncbi:hypothetical protein KO481_11760 [Nocardia sp. NEAU-G5]|uniref:Uncharacterized protein n=1 Tax=Nocardia albiluteola TaxID=2842303 RepID=A0ABS6AVY9_9NOCA|nr:hypothetical protein [Nocardia albiluteola]MBU3062199.1 hypothetical protein [Nocardia albiluteola]